MITKYAILLNGNTLYLKWDNTTLFFDFLLDAQEFCEHMHFWYPETIYTVLDVVFPLP